jgi:hypothetical protein
VVLEFLHDVNDGQVGHGCWRRGCWRRRRRVWVAVGGGGGGGLGGLGR